MPGQTQPRSPKRRSSPRRKQAAGAELVKGIPCSAELVGSRIHFKKGALVTALRKKLGLKPEDDIICSALVHLPRTATTPTQDDPGTIVDVRC